MRRSNISRRSVYVILCPSFTSSSDRQSDSTAEPAYASTSSPAYLKTVGKSTLPAPRSMAFIASPDSFGPISANRFDESISTNAASTSHLQRQR